LLVRLNLIGIATQSFWQRLRHINLPSAFLNFDEVLACLFAFIGALVHCYFFCGIQSNSPIATVMTPSGLLVFFGKRYLDIGVRFGKAVLEPVVGTVSEGALHFKEFVQVCKVHCGLAVMLNNRDQLLIWYNAVIHSVP